jgi:hypothetical protein
MNDFRRTRPLSEPCEKCGTDVVFRPDQTIPDVVLCANCK